ncbi:hypothetical protein [Capnocytophaga sp. oral taxon 324]|jgi:hypothetical protein|uniref:hypothetical protein n=1 Tax=Capnocytophaga sp. oral taxon 324 TaxID=712211 RepID=UPI0002A3FF70|nr:hypothetical protein [Capnocytophaga sp. oral taxon 324]EKY12962.1 hypothetical protein HMPREF9072_01764 [Capnocytophaga sp. oral taxon 324 str. F0483]
MIKKFFLLAFMVIGATACSKSDDTSANSGNNNNLLGTWVGTAEIIAEKPAQQSKVSELFRQNYGALLGSAESNYQTYTVKVVFNSEKELKITDKTGQYSFQELKYSTLGDKIINEENKLPLATYAIENNRLLAENTDFFYLITDSNLDNLTNAEEYLKEFAQLDTTAPDYAKKLIELQLKYGLAYKYKYKYNLVRQ